MSKGAGRQQLIRDIVREILDDSQFRSWVREVVLVTLFEAEQMRDNGIVHEFLRDCARLGVTLRPADDGHVMVRGASKLSAMLKGILEFHRRKIWEHLLMHGEHVPIRTNGRTSNGHRLNGHGSNGVKR